MLSVAEWLPDPTGRHALRYWDGTRWSDAVDDGTGVASVDGLAEQPPPAAAVAGWYPDPLGRHQARYWDGVSWSPSVADAGAVLEDTVGTVDVATPGPPATIAAWYPDPSGRYRMRFWETDHWSPVVSNGGTDLQNADPDPSWPPPAGPRLAPPRLTQGPRTARRAGWHMGAALSLKAQGRNRCPQCGGKLRVVEVARPGCILDYTPDTTMQAYPPCETCGFVPPWATVAGLYPDPTHRHEYRYWDGTTWTDRVADAGVGAADPMAVTAG